MAIRVLVPLLGEGVEEVTVTKWLKQEGDTVRELEPLLEVNTDKVDTEIPAPASGTVLKIVAQEGLAARVGEILAFIGKPGESTEGASAAVAKVESSRANPAAAGQPVSYVQQPAGQGAMGFVSPVVARIAAEHGVELAKVRGTGLNGRVTKNDVLLYVEHAKSGRASQAPVPTAGIPAVPTRNWCTST